jgi:hypothetical protein
MGDLGSLYFLIRHTCVCGTLFTRIKLNQVYLRKQRSTYKSAILADIYRTQVAEFAIVQWHSMMKASKFQRYVDDLSSPASLAYIRNGTHEHKYRLRTRPGGHTSKHKQAPGGAGQADTARHAGRTQRRCSIGHSLCSEIKFASARLKGVCNEGSIVSSRMCGSSDSRRIRRSCR